MTGPRDLAPVHDPVMVDRVVELFAAVPAGVHVDATLGDGGHAAAGTEVVVNGALDRIEIWAPEVWDALSDEGNDALQDAMRKGGL